MFEESEIIKLVALSEMQSETLNIRKNGITARVRNNCGKSFIVKLWKKSGFSGKFRRLTRTGNIDRELKTLKHLNNYNIVVPKVLASLRFNKPIDGYTEGILFEDLGKGEDGVQYLSRLIRSDSNDERLKFENEIINLTQKIINAGVLDNDHTLVNILVLPSAQIIRLDFEISIVCCYPTFHLRKFARMVAGLIASHIIAVHPHTDPHSKRFASKISERLKLSTEDIYKINSYLKQLLEIQRKASGIKFNSNLHW